MSEVTGERTGKIAEDATPAGDSEGFVERWSRRKTESALVADNPVARAEGEEPVPATQVDDEPATDEQSPQPELPPLDSLDENSDYSAFLAPGVCSDLKRQALRQLFQGPKFNVRDGLDDYDLDFTSFEPLGDVVTADMRHRMLRGLEKLAELDGVDDPGDAGAVQENVEPAECDADDDDAEPA